MGELWVQRGLATTVITTRAIRRVIARTEPLAFVSNREVSGDLVDDERFTSVYLRVLASLHDRGSRATLEDLDALING